MLEDNIQFEEIRSDEQQGKTSTHAFKSPISGAYSDLFSELKDKCDPAKFMNPYDPEKVNKANTLFSQIITSDKHDEWLMKLYRQRAMEDLGVKFATKKIYDDLITICNPENFTGEFYNPSMLAHANAVYQRILENADNVVELEKLMMESTDLIEFVKEKNRIQRDQLNALIIEQRKIDARKAAKEKQEFIIGITITGLFLIGVIIAIIIQNH